MSTEDPQAPHNFQRAGDTVVLVGGVEVPVQRVELGVTVQAPDILRTLALTAYINDDVREELNRLADNERLKVELAISTSTQPQSSVTDAIRTELTRRGIRLHDDAINAIAAVAEAAATVAQPESSVKDIRPELDSQDDDDVWRRGQNVKQALLARGVTLDDDVIAAIVQAACDPSLRPNV